MKSMQEHEVPATAEGEARSRYHAPQLIEFGELAMRTLQAPHGAVNDGHANSFTG
jgi:hypothetical protein